MSGKLLEVDDVIYGSTVYGGVCLRYRVARVTKTQAVCGNTKFRREIGKTGWVDITPKPSGWSGVSYRIATPELEKKYNTNRMVAAMESVKWKLVEYDDLKEIYKLYTNLCT